MLAGTVQCVCFGDGAGKWSCALFECVWQLFSAVQGPGILKQNICFDTYCLGL